MIKKNTKIIVNIELDENKIPEKISWISKDIEIKKTDVKAFMISFWSNISIGSERIDLWIKKMPLDEMKIFFYQNFLSMADTYYRATSDKDFQKEIIIFANNFAKKNNFFN